MKIINLTSITAEGATDANTLVFKLAAQCSRIPQAAKNEKDPLKVYANSNGTLAISTSGLFPWSCSLTIGRSVNLLNRIVTSGYLEWQPKGEQPMKFAGRLPKAFQDDILLVKMRPGQELSTEMHCVKGIGKDHAKFSPVGQFDP